MMFLSCIHFLPLSYSHPTPLSKNKFKNSLKDKFTACWDPNQTPPSCLPSILCHQPFTLGVDSQEMGDSRPGMLVRTGSKRVEGSFSFTCDLSQGVGGQSDRNVKACSAC